MKTILLVALSIVSLAASSQKSDSWKISLNKKLLLSAAEENETKNILAISRPSLNKQGEFRVQYKEAIPNNDWVRTFAIFDGDTSIFEKVSKNDFSMPTSKLKKLIGHKKQIKVYTWSLPKNPMLASTIRLRRIHLCTINLQ